MKSPCWQVSFVASLVGAVVALGSLAEAQQISESALKDRVSQLVERLESPKLETRAAAEKSLIELGVRALPFFPTRIDPKKADLVERLDRIRTAVQAKTETTNLGASRITLKAKGIRLSEALKALQTQSGNEFTDLREANGTEVTNPAVDLDIDDKCFFEALDILTEKAGVAYTPYTNDGTLGLIAGGMMEAQPNMPAKGKPLLVYSGPFRVQFKEIAIVKDFTTPTGTATAQFEVLWEPRIRPMLLSIKNEDLKIVDDQGKPVLPQVSQEANETGLRAGNCAAEMNLNLIAPERTAKVLSSFKVKGDVTVPSGMKAFKFPNLGATNVVQKQGDISVTLESCEVDEQTWKVGLVLAYPEGGPAFESYRQGLFNNRPWLQKSDGFRFEHNGGMNDSGGGGDGKVGFEFMFVDVQGKPSDYMFVYETPAKVVPIPLEFEFKDVPLP